MNYRRSRQREIILQFLRRSTEHPIADLIYEKLRVVLPNLSLGTVYRNLGVLIEQGHVQKLSSDGGFDRFEAKIEPHYHLICEKCGKVQDFNMPHPVDINKQAQSLCDFSISRHRIDFYGICKECLPKTTP